MGVSMKNSNSWGGGDRKLKIKQILRRKYVFREAAKSIKCFMHLIKLGILICNGLVIKNGTGIDNYKYRVQVVTHVKRCLNRIQPWYSLKVFLLEGGGFETPYFLLSTRTN